MNQIKIGWGEASLVPEGKKVNLVGQFYERISDEVETPISVTALAIECGEDQAIFCSCDLVSVSERVVAGVRTALSSVPGFPTDKIIVSAIHTHTSLGYAHRSDSVKGSSLDVLREMLPDAKYEELVSYQGDDLFEGEPAFLFVVERIAAAAKAAWENRAVGAYATGFGRAAVGMCRRVCYDDGSAKMWGDTNEAAFTELEGGNDSGIELMFTYTPDKKLTGVVANVACPAQVLEHRSFISSDYFGKVKGLIREKYGKDVYLLGIVSPAGDQCPRDLVRWVEPETPINDPNIDPAELRGVTMPTLIIAGTKDMIRADHSGCGTSPGVQAMEAHDVQTSGRLGSKTFCKSPQIFDLLLFRGIFEFIGYSGSVFDLHGDDGHGAHGSAAVGFCSIFGNDIHLFIKSEGEDLISHEGKRPLRSKLRQGAFSVDEVDQFVGKFRREQRSLSKYICHFLLLIVQIFEQFL